MPIYRAVQGPALIVRWDRRMWLLVVRRLGTARNQIHGLEDGLDDGFISDCGVEHQVIQRTGWPVSIEVVLYVGDALAIDGINHLVRFLLAVSFADGAADLF